MKFENGELYHEKLKMASWKTQLANWNLRIGWIKRVNWKLNIENWNLRFETWTLDIQNWNLRIENWYLSSDHLKYHTNKLYKCDIKIYLKSN